jgi:hypothetical protein
MNSAKNRDKSRPVFEDGRLGQTEEILNTIDSNLNSLLFYGTPTQMDQRRGILDTHDQSSRKKISFFTNSDMKTSEGNEYEKIHNFNYLNLEKSDWSASGTKSKGFGHKSNADHKKEFINIIESEDGGLE